MLVRICLLTVLLASLLVAPATVRAEAPSASDGVGSELQLGRWDCFTQTDSGPQWLLYLILAADRSFSTSGGLGGGTYATFGNAISFTDEMAGYRAENVSEDGLHFELVKLATNNASPVQCEHISTVPSVTLGQPLAGQGSPRAGAWDCYQSVDVTPLEGERVSGLEVWARLYLGGDHRYSTDRGRNSGDVRWSDGALFFSGTLAPLIGLVTPDMTEITIVDGSISEPDADDAIVCDYVGALADPAGTPERAVPKTAPQPTLAPAQWGAPEGLAARPLPGIWQCSSIKVGRDYMLGAGWVELHTDGTYVTSADEGGGAWQLRGDETARTTDDKLTFTGEWRDFEARNFAGGRRFELVARGVIAPPSPCSLAGGDTPLPDEEPATAWWMDGMQALMIVGLLALAVAVLAGIWRRRRSVMAGPLGEHRAWVSEVRVSSYQAEYMAVCSCGWHSLPQTNSYSALTLAELHTPSVQYIIEKG